MASKPVPFSHFKPRMSDLGRIRGGYKGDRRPIESRTWILSAQTPDNLELLADIYGGTVEHKERSDSDDKYWLTTESEGLEVVLPDEPLSEPRWQKWNGKFLARNCDAVTCTVFEKGKRPIETDCLCQGIDSERDWCKPKMHLSVILPQCPIGAWRLVTTSKNAVAELQTSIDLIRAASSLGFPRAVLTRVDRTSGEKQYRVPTLTTKASFEQLEAAASQAAAVGAVPAAPALGHTRMELPAGAVNVPSDVSEFWEDDDVIDAELVDEPQEPVTAPVSPPAASPAKPRRSVPKSVPSSQIGNLGPRDVGGFYSRMAPQDAEALEAVLAGAGLWPIAGVPAKRGRELVSVARPVIEKAVADGRLEI